MNDSYEWRQVVGFEGIYEVRQGCDGGRVKRVIPIQRSRVGYELFGIDPYGYPRVVLSKPGKRPKYCRIHELILEAWVGHRPSGHQANHRDDIKTNNVISNLYWGTKAQNVKDMVANKLHWKFTKPDTPKKVWETRRRNGPSKQMIMIEFEGRMQCISDWAKELGISRSCMTKRLKRWSLKDALTRPKTQKRY